MKTSHFFSSKYSKPLIILVLGFLSVTAAIWYLPQVQMRDILFSEWMSVRSQATLEMMRVLTTLGNLGVIATLGVLVFLRLKMYHPVSVNERAVLRSIGVTGLIAVMTKELFTRPRPELSLYQEVGWSYPSFHAAIAVGLYGYIIYLFAVRYPRYRAWIWISGGVLIGLIAISRVFLNVHYLSDIVAGMLVGGIGLTIALMTDKYRDV